MVSRLHARLAQVQALKKGSTRGSKGRSCNRIYRTRVPIRTPYFVSIYCLAPYTRPTLCFYSSPSILPAFPACSLITAMSIFLYASVQSVCVFSSGGNCLAYSSASFHVSMLKSRKYLWRAPTCSLTAWRLPNFLSFDGK
jgi:hypothetical protein